MSTPDRDVATHLENAAVYRAEAEEQDMITHAQMAMSYAQYEVSLAVVAELRGLREALASRGEQE